MNIPRTWRKWILGWVFFALIGIQISESTHHHESAALQNACVVCQLVTHQQLDVPPPIDVPMAAVLLLLFTVLYSRHVLLIADTDYVSYSSRAPPYLSV
jgi:hypothetical protein